MNYMFSIHSNNLKISENITKKYNNIKLIGKGGFGKVYGCNDNSTNQSYFF